MLWRENWEDLEMLCRRQLRTEAEVWVVQGDTSLGGRVGHLREVRDLGQETSGQVGGRPETLRKRMCEVYRINQLMIARSVTRSKTRYIILFN